MPVKKKSDKTVCLIGLGCPKNQVDAEMILGELDSAGFEISIDPEQADTIIVNTCSFLKAARLESLEIIEQMLDLKKAGFIKQVVVSGCMADYDRRYLGAIGEEIDQFLSPFHIDQTLQILTGSNPVQMPMKPGKHYRPEGSRLVTTPRSYGYLKIADGCDNHCAFCRIPYLRGSFRSREPEDVIFEAQGLVESGRREIVVISQDNLSYGKDNLKIGDLCDLLKNLVRIKDLKWLRLMYLYPAGITEALLRFVADNPVICRYLDLPLQHVDAHVLKGMNRRVPLLPGQVSMDLGEFLETIRKWIPGITIRATLMTGYPGENKKSFEKMLNLVAEGAFDHLGVFTWSCEPNTKAAKLQSEAVERQEAEERAAQLMEVQADVVVKRNRERLNKVYDVVIDGPDDEEGYMLGRLEFQAPEVDGWVRLQGDYEPGTWLKACLNNVDIYDFKGIVVDKL